MNNIRIFADGRREAISLRARSIVTSRLRDTLFSTLIRASMLPLAGVAAVLGSRLVIGNGGGVQGYALYSLLVSLPSLIPISDFGLAAVVTDAIAKHGPRSDEFKHAWVRSQRLLWLISLVTVAASAIAGALGLWSGLLGGHPRDHIDLWATIVATEMAVAIPLGAGQRVLLGVGKQGLATFLLSAAPILGFAMMWTCSLIGVADGASLAVISCAGPLLCQAIVFIASMEYVRRALHVKSAEQSLTKPAIGSTAWPMAILLVSAPILFQSDRVLLSHFSSTTQVANYSLVAMIYTPLLSIIVLGQQPLWPLFIRARQNRDEVRRWYARCVLLFALLGAGLGTALVLLGPIVTRFASRAVTTPPLPVFAGFGLLLVMFGLNAAPGMFLMDKSGRIQQAIGAVVAVVVKILIALVLVPVYGATGAVSSTLLSASAFMVVPSLITATLRVSRITRVPAIPG